VFASNDRRSLRNVFFRAWEKHRANQPLEGAERLIVQIALRHPEYQTLLETPDAEDHDYPPELGSNPFLHMAMHIAIEEGLMVDQPFGVLATYRDLLQHHPDEHDLQHRMMDCLNEMLWRAQREQRAPDQQAYLDCVRRLSSKT
jgi:hypothetical protein